MIPSTAADGPVVSVVIPNYNHARFLRERIESVLTQTYPHFEVIILDDASTDNSREIIEEYRTHARVSQIIYNVENGGSTFSQWSKGIAISKGAYIWLAESDDRAEPAFLDRCVSAIRDSPDLVLVFTDSRIVDEHDNILHSDLNFWYEDLSPSKWGHSYTNDGRKEIVEGMCIKNGIPNASAVVFRKVFYPEIITWRFCGDWMFWIRVLETGRMAFIKECLNNFRSHGQTTRHAPQTRERYRQFLKERLMIAAYLNKKKLIDKELFERQKKEFIDTWKNAFKLMEMGKKEFFTPFGETWLLGLFILNKLFNGFKTVFKSFNR